MGEYIAGSVEAPNRDPKAVPARLSLGSKSETERSDTLFGGLVEFRTRKIT